MDFVTDWREPTDFGRMRAFRVERTRTAMEQHGLDAVVGFEYANARYITGLRPLWAPNYLTRQAGLITRASEAILCFVHQDDMPHRRRTMTWMPDGSVREFPTGAVNYGDARKGLEPIVAGLAELGFTEGRLGVDVGTPTVFAALRELLPKAEIVDANPAMGWARMIKNEDELDLMRSASAIVDVAMGVAVDAAQPGVRECEVLAEVMHVFYRHGAEIPQCNLIVCSGPNTAPMQRFAGDRMIREGDLVFMDIGACFNGMFSEATRTVIAGEPNDEQRAIYRTVSELHEAAIGAMRGGASADDLRAAVDGPYRASPYAGRMQRMVIGHGIGIAAVEGPFIAPPGGAGGALTLEPGMTIAIVPTLLVPGVPGGGGVRLEDIVIVTDDGVERVTRFPYDGALLD